MVMMMPVPGGDRHARHRAHGQDQRGDPRRQPLSHPPSPSDMTNPGRSPGLLLLSLFDAIVPGHDRSSQGARPLSTGRPATAVGAKRTRPVNE